MSRVSDCHGIFSRFKNLPKEEIMSENVGIIILGDVGFNIFCNENDSHNKNYLKKISNCYFYCVRGNHEARPQDVPGMRAIYDENVHGTVYVQDSWPKIRYFTDYNIYIIGDYRTLVIGGAYSVDKYYRLRNGWSWFANEQLNEQERSKALEMVENQSFDLVLTHTCPKRWEPTELFLPSIDQSTVDSTMEDFLDTISMNCTFKVWLFGHFHADKIIRPGVQMMFTETYDLDQIMDWWNGICMNGHYLEEAFK